MGVTEQGRNALIEKIKGKKILYIATKNEDYIRVQQEINLIRRYAVESTIIVSKNKNYIKRIIYVYRKLLMTSVKKYDVVFVGFMAQMIIPFWKLKFKKKLVVVDFFISIYDTLVDDRKKIKDGGILAKIVHKIDQSTIRNARYIVCDTNAHGRYFGNEFGVESSKFIVFYLEADQSIYHPMESVRPLEMQEKYLVLYFGSILPVQGVDIVMQTIEKLSDNKDIYFLIIGPVSNKVKKATTDNVTYIDWLPQEKLAEYISFCDLCLAGHFSATVGKARRTIPGKAYIYQAMGKPMILGDSEANRELFSENTCSFFVPLGNSAKLAEKIILCKEDSKNE